MAREKAWGWRPAIKVKGALVWGKTFATQAEAFRASQAMRETREEVESRPLAAQAMTIADAFEETIQRLLDEDGSEVTARGYRTRFRIWSDFIDPEALVAQVTADDVRALIRSRRTRDKLGANGIRQDLRVLHRVLAVGGFPPDRNPARKRTKSDPHGVDWPEEKQPDRPFFTMRQIAKAEASIRESGNPAAEFHADLIVFLAVTGLRSFELSRLRQGDVEFDTERGGGAIRVQGKRGGVRRVAFHEQDAPIVRRLLGRAVDGPIIAPSSLSTILKRWSKKLDLPGFSARALRRTFATDMADGSDLRTIQSQLGHSQLTTTQKYLGEQPELARAAAERRSQRLRSEGEASA
ncbi:MAG: site-specific integrase [bacterium]|nr:site-specific integrase [bacterium]